MIVALMITKSVSESWQLSLDSSYQEEATLYLGYFLLAKPVFSKCDLFPFISDTSIGPKL